MTTSTDDTTQANLLELVRYASKNAQVLHTKRDAAVREAYRAGATQREIASASDISHTTVKRIVERTEGRRTVER